MERISFQVAEFEAPLDLILHLLSKHKLDILEIDISSLLQQYISAIESWQENDLDVSSEFLEMASRLVYMKTVSLLPRHEEESEQLKRDFQQQLMEYRMCKIAAQFLSDVEQYGDKFVRRPMDIDIDPTYKENHPPETLYNALVDAMGKEARRRPPSRDAFDGIVAKPIVSVSVKIFSVLRRLRTQHIVSLRQLFADQPQRSDLIATFLAVLELIKAGTIWIEEDRLSLKKPA